MRPSPSRPEHEAIEAFRAKLVASTEVLRPGQSEQSRTVSYAAEVASKSARHCHLLSSLVQETKPAQALELGTLLGVSAAYFGAALKANGSGHLTTIEYLERACELAGELMVEVGLASFVTVRNGLFEEVVPEVVVAVGPLDLVFKDGQHTREATVDWFRRLVPSMTEGALFLFDDIAWSTDMALAWEDIRTSADVSLAVEFGGQGLVVIRRGRPGGSASHHRIPELL
jgi:predicted O-methyltransferase YrrM